MQKIIHYINRIKNVPKKTYAQEFYLYLTAGHAKPNAAGLSTMAKQAVEMNLRDLLVLSSKGGQYEK